MAIETAIAAGTVSTTYGFILNFLLPSMREELGLLTGFRSELKKLQSLFTRIQSVLEDAMTRQMNSHALHDWLEKLMEVGYHADDVLDEFSFEALRRKTASQEGHLREVRDFFSGNNPLKFRFLMAHKIKDLRGRIDSFAEEVSRFNPAVAPPRPTRHQDEQVTHSFEIPSNVIGRDEDKKRVVKVLLRAGSASGNISVVAIVGVGGIGKTTLAQLVRNDSEVSECFHPIIWICVSDNFVLQWILISIIKQVTEKNCEADELDTLQRKIRKELYGKKFLLVLDNVWNEEQAKWEELEKLIRCGARGSKVMVTTRSLKVPSIMGSSHVLRLNSLPDNICWDLFRGRAFGDREKPSEDLMAIGKEIVKKCRGIPLAAQALGSALRFKRDMAEWRLVEKNEIWQLFQSETDELMPVLRLSYDHLSSEAKQCFSFCSLFPKDYEMEKETLIWQWTCNKFVVNQRGHGGGHEVFNDLLWRSFFLETKKDEDGGVKKCKLHDLMHDLARLVAGKQFCMVTKDTSGDNVNERTYHLLIHQWSSGFPKIEETKKAKYLRTLLVPKCDPIEKSSLKRIFVKLRCLRVLDLSSSEIKVIPDSVGCLIHLRYLDLSSRAIELLPESICYLLNLQVLKLRGTKLQKLPEGLKSVRSLRHLDIRSCSFLTDMPVGVERLTNLQTLTDFKVGTMKTSCALQELRDLNLSGELFIWHLENFKTEPTEIQQTILLNKENLVSLRLTWNHLNNSMSNDDIRRALNLLKPHQNLKRLLLHNYTGLEFPPWLSESLLPCLVEIKLLCCTKCEHLPAFGSIPCLKDLQIIGMHEVRQISGEFYGTGLVKGFPSLEKLALFDMPELKEWYVLEGISFPKLKVLTIGKCRALNYIPWVQSLHTLEISHCSSSLLASLPNGPNLPAISSLLLDNIPELTFLPDGLLVCFSSLRKLLVSSCQKLEYLPLNDMQQLVMLQSLQISDCPELNSLSFNASQMNHLRSLNICNCISLMSLPQNWTGITSLQSISITECRNLTSWTEVELMGLSSLSDFTLEICNNRVNVSGLLPHVTNLKTLTIHGGHDNLHPKPSKLIAGNSIIICCCGDMLDSLLQGLSNASSLEDLMLKHIPGTALPDSIGEIQSLQSLSIDDCAELTSLPDNVRGRLKVWVQGCPVLETQQ